MEETIKRVRPFSKSNQNVWHDKILFLPFYIQIWEDAFLFLLLYLSYFPAQPLPIPESTPREESPEVALCYKNIIKSKWVFCAY